jgi:hypothetical protein
LSPLDIAIPCLGSLCHIPVVSNNISQVLDQRAMNSE